MWNTLSLFMQPSRQKLSWTHTRLCRSHNIFVAKGAALCELQDVMNEELLIHKEMSLTPYHREFYYHSFKVSWREQLTVRQVDESLIVQSCSKFVACVPASEDATAARRCSVLICRRRLPPRSQSFVFCLCTRDIRLISLAKAKAQKLAAPLSALSAN